MTSAALTRSIGEISVLDKAPSALLRALRQADETDEESFAAYRLVGSKAMASFSILIAVLLQSCAVEASPSHYVRKFLWLVAVLVYTAREILDNSFTTYAGWDKLVEDSKTEGNILAHIASVRPVERAWEVACDNPTSRMRLEHAVTAAASLLCLNVLLYSLRILGKWYSSPPPPDPKIYTHEKW